MYVDCAYRVHPDGEILTGLFDTDEGVIVDRPELFNIRELPPDISFSRENYESPIYEISLRNVVNTLCQNFDALLVINYNCIGYLIFRRGDFKRLFCIEELAYHPWEKIPDIKQFKFVGKFGLRRTRIATYDVVQPYPHIIAIKLGNGETYVYTQRSRYRLGVALDEFSTPDKVLYWKMVETPRAFGIGVYRGKPVILKAYQDEINLM